MLLGSWTYSAVSDVVGVSSAQMHICLALLQKLRISETGMSRDDSCSEMVLQLFAAKAGLGWQPQMTRSYGLSVSTNTLFNAELVTLSKGKETKHFWLHFPPFLATISCLARNARHKDSCRDWCNRIIQLSQQNCRQSKHSPW